MRGSFQRQATLLSIVSPEQRVPQDNPLRKIKAMADCELGGLSRVFDAVVKQTRGAGLMSDEHFIVDGTLIVRCNREISF